MKNNIICKLIVVALMLFCLTSCNEEPQKEEIHVHEWTIFEVTKEPTCKNVGSKERHCIGCDEKETIELNMIAHTFDEGKITKESTCSEEGIIEFTCQVCSKNVKEKLPALAHNETLLPGKAPTCHEAGLTDGSYCDLCNQTIKEQESLPATGHAWGKEVFINKPTCEAEGKVKITCTTCRAVVERKVAKLEHEITFVNYTEPTCTKGGLIGAAHCAWCDQDIYTQTVVSPLGHNYVNGECVRCLEVEAEDGMKFKLVNGGYYLADAGKITNPMFVVPTMYNNNYVVGILEGAFEKAEFVNTICIPASIEVIEEGAFNGCRYLQSFIVAPENAYYELNSNCIVEKATKILIAGAAYADIEEGVLEIGPSAFKDRIGVTLIDIPSTIQNIAEDAFEGCNNIAVIRVSEANANYYGKDNCIILKANKTLLLGCQSSLIPEGIEVIETGAFAGCEALKDIKIPASVTTIKPKAFTGCIYVSKLEISASVTSLEGAFEGLTSLTEIIVDEKNAKYSVVDGCLVEKETKTLILSNQAGFIPEDIEVIGTAAFAGNVTITSIVLPETVKVIGERAFADCVNLKTVKLTSSVTTIKDEAFAGCKNFDKIVIPDSVTSIGAGAFIGCENMQRIELSDNIKTIGENAFKDCTILLIVCESKKKPEGWHANYNPDERPEFWGNYIVN